MRERVPLPRGAPQQKMSAHLFSVKNVQAVIELGACSHSKLSD